MSTPTTHRTSSRAGRCGPGAGDVRGMPRDLVDTVSDRRELVDAANGLSSQTPARTRRDLIIDAARTRSRPADITALDLALAAHLSLERSRAR